MDETTDITELIQKALNLMTTNLYYFCLFIHLFIKTTPTQ